MDDSFPTDPREFDADDRISFSKLDNKFIAVHDDGTEFEFDPEWRRWMPAAEDPLGHDALDAHGAGEGDKRKRKNGSRPDLEVS
jgi:HIV Tat-specific factor 1